MSPRDMYRVTRPGVLGVQIGSDQSESRPPGRVGLHILRRFRP